MRMTREGGRAAGGWGQAGWQVYLCQQRRYVCCGVGGRQVGKCACVNRAGVSVVEGRAEPGPRLCAGSPSLQSPRTPCSPCCRPHPQLLLLCPGRQRFLGHLLNALEQHKIVAAQVRQGWGTCLGTTRQQAVAISSWQWFSDSLMRGCRVAPSPPPASAGPQPSLPSPSLAQGLHL